MQATVSLALENAACRWLERPLGRMLALVAATCGLPWQQPAGRRMSTDSLIQTISTRRRADAILIRRTDRLPFAAPTEWESFEPLLRLAFEPMQSAWT